VNRAIDEIDPDDAVMKLRLRLDGVLEARRLELAVECGQVRQEALTSIAAARRAAHVITTRAVATQPIPGPLELVAWTEPAPAVTPTEFEPFARLVGPELLAPPVAEDLIVGAAFRPTGLTPAVTIVDAQTMPDAGVERVAPPTVDTQALVAAFTTIVETMLDERLSRWAPAPEVKKPSFWKNARHPDVILVGIIMFVCLIVVGAWMS
jgi:hypothetical protein